MKKISRCLFVLGVLCSILIMVAGCGGSSGGGDSDNDVTDGGSGGNTDNTGGGSTEEDLCSNYTCSENGHCVVQDGAAQCVCDAGFVEYGDACVEEGAVGPWPKPGLLSDPAPCDECSDANGDQFYVDDVAQSGDGTLGNPFNSIQEAVDLAQPGDTVYVLPGTYTLTRRIATQRDGMADKYICIRAYDPEDRPVLQRWVGDGVEEREVCAASPAAYNTEYGGEIFLVRNQYIVIDGFIIDGHYNSEDFQCRYAESFKGVSLNTRSYTELVVFAHYGVCRNDGGPSSDEYDRYDYNADHSIIRNCDIGYNQVDTVTVAADDVLIENCEIHHGLRQTFDEPKDAHCVSVTHARDVTLRYVDLHQCSGDLLQVDNDITNDCGTQLWDNVLVEHSRLWTGDLLADDAPHAGYNVGESPGENALDTKTFEDTQLLTHRPHMTVRNVEAFGFDTNGYISNRSVFNIKYRVDWLLDGIRVHDSQWAFRIRGGADNEAQGSAHPTLMNIVAYDNTNVARIERDVEELQILNATFGPNDGLFVHADCAEDPCYDTATYRMENTLFLASDLPEEALEGAANLAVAEDCFTDVAGRDFSLLDTCTAVDAGETIEAVTHDVKGEERFSGNAYDVGAFESH